MNPNEWVMSMDNPTRARYAAECLWKQGIRASDRTAIILCYGYNEHEADILCKILADRERIAEAWKETYNPDLGF